MVPRDRRLVVQVDEYQCLRTSSPTPVLFRVNRESRAEMLRHYSTPYTLASYPPEHPQPALHRHYFDPEVDIIRVPRYINNRVSKGSIMYLLSWFLELEDPKDRFQVGEELSKVRFLEIEWNVEPLVFGTEYGCIEDGDNEFAKLEELFAKMTSIKEFRMIRNTFRYDKSHTYTITFRFDKIPIQKYFVSEDGDDSHQREYVIEGFSPDSNKYVYFRSP